MRKELILRRRNGESSNGFGEFQIPAPAARVTKASLVGGLSLILGIGSIFIPIAHFFLPWMIPLAGGIYAYSLLSDKGTLSDVRGACPGCTKEVEFTGGNVERPMWRRCPQCGEPVDVEVKAPPA